MTYSIERMEPTVGRFALVSNPFTDPGAETMGWKLIKYDKFGRAKQVSFYRGSSKPSPFGENANKSGDVIYAYNGDTTSVTDEAGNVRTTVVDALGRILSASGGGTATATYIHNALDNLTGVTQIDPSTYPSSKTQTRTFDTAR